MGRDGLFFAEAIIGLFMRDAHALVLYNPTPFPNEPERKDAKPVNGGTAYHKPPFAYFLFCTCHGESYLRFN
jgi:hypothetical protein